MAQPKLTPYQQRLFLRVANAWGDCFTLPYNYGYMAERGLVRKATAAELEAHYARLREELAAAHGRLVALIAEGKYAQAQEYLESCAGIQRKIRNRAEDRERMCALSDLGREVTAKLRAKGRS